MSYRTVLSIVIEKPGTIKVHNHHCFQIIISIDNPLDLICGNETVKNVYGFVVNRNVAHGCIATNATMVSIFIDAGSIYDSQLAEMLNGKDYVLLYPTTPNTGIDIIPLDYKQQPKKTIAIMVNTYLTNLLQPYNNETIEMDKRIKAAIRFIEKHLQEKIGVASVAEVVHLSPDRLRHLFKKETGVAISQYILWKRIKQVLALSMDGMVPMSLACQKYNFPDQSHYSHMFIKAFGMPPKAFMNSSFIIKQLF